MTLNEFFDALEKVPGEWTTDAYGRIRHVEPRCCPMAAVAIDAPGWKMWWGDTAGRYLGMSEKDKTDVMHSADATSGALRARLLKACKLTEAA